MKEIRLFYTDFWGGFDPENNIFSRIISRSYKIILDDINPDYLIYSCFGNDHFKYYNAVKIYYTGENNVPNLHSLIYLENEADIDRAIEEIITLDQNDQLYLKKLAEPWFISTSIKRNGMIESMRFF